MNRTYSVDEAPSLVKHPKFDINVKTVLLLHGFRSSPYFGGPQGALRGYLKYREYNVIAADYSELVSRRYFSESVPNIQRVSVPDNRIS